MAENALVAAFDLLAFKDMMRDGENLAHLANKVSRLVAVVKGVGSEPTKFTVDGIESNLSPSVIQASDTFVVYAQPDGIQDIVQFLWNIQSMAFYAIQLKFPLRGAVTMGRVAASVDENLYLGPGVLEALSLEAIANWSGIIVSSRMANTLDSSGMLARLSPLILEFEPPIKGGYRSQHRDIHYCVNWMADPAGFIHPDYLHSKFPPVRSSNSLPEEVSRKIANTRQFLEHSLSIRSHRPPENRNLQISGRRFDGSQVLFESDLATRNLR